MWMWFVLEKICECDAVMFPPLIGMLFLSPFSLNYLPKYINKYRIDVKKSSSGRTGNRRVAKLGVFYFVKMLFLHRLLK